MNRYIVTIKLPRRKDHDPHNKKNGQCPVYMLSNHLCDDVTGEHHSFLFESDKDIEGVRAVCSEEGRHVTRIERV